MFSWTKLQRFHLTKCKVLRQTRFRTSSTIKCFPCIVITQIILGLFADVFEISSGAFTHPLANRLGSGNITIAPSKIYLSSYSLFTSTSSARISKQSPDNANVYAPSAFFTTFPLTLSLPGWCYFSTTLYLSLNISFFQRLHER